MGRGLVAWWAERPLPLPFPPFSENTLSWEPLAERQTRHPFIVIGCRRGGAEAAIIISNGMEWSSLLYFLPEMLIFARVLV